MIDATNGSSITLLSKVRRLEAEIELLKEQGNPVLVEIDLEVDRMKREILLSI